MSKKKSYMDIKNVVNEDKKSSVSKPIVKEEKVNLSEGFFSKLKSLFGFGSKHEKALKKDRIFMGYLKNLNRTTKSLEDRLSRQVGEKVKLNRFNVSDFT